MKMLVKSFAVIAFMGVVFLNSSSTQAFSERTLVRLVNQNRTTPLTIDPALTKIAQERANDMVAKNYFSHVSPDGHRAWWFLEQHHYYYHQAGENLALDFQTNKQAVDAWMASPGHKANIVNPAFTKTGIGIAHTGKHYYIVQLFIQP
jgi:uncharacterized protein YkwD